MSSESTAHTPLVVSNVPTVVCCVSRVRPVPSESLIPTFLAVWTEDRARIEQVIARLDAQPGRVAIGLRLLAEAGIAAVEGGPEEGAAAFVAALDFWSSITEPIQVAAFQAAFCKLVGADQADAARAGAASRAWARETGARHLETVWAEGMPADAAGASETA